MATKMNDDELPMDKGVLCVSGKSEINAPPNYVFDIHTNPATWPEWNSFVPSTTIETSPPEGQGDQRGLFMDAVMVLKVRMTPDSGLRDQKEQVTELTRPYSNGEGSSGRACWKAIGLPQFLLNAVRVSEFHLKTANSGEQICEFTTYEVFKGPLAWAIRQLFGDALQSRFEDWARELKEYSEKTWAGNSQVEGAD